MAYRKVLKICAGCGSESLMPVINKYCSHKCFSLSLVGEGSHHWKGNDVGDAAARKRAAKRYPLPATCDRCDQPPTDRHHLDRNPRNNDPANIAFLCALCHQGEHRKLTQEQEDEIKRARAAGATQTSLARQYGVDQSLVSLIVNGRPARGRRTAS